MESYDFIRQSAAAFLLPDYGILAVEGDDTLAYLHRMLTQDVVSLGAREVRPSTLCTHKGKLLGEVLVMRWDDRIFLLISPGHFDALFMQLERYIIADDVSLTDVSNTWTLATIQGPNAPASCDAAWGTQTQPFEQNFQGTEGTLDTQPFFVFEHSRSGERGLDALIPTSLEETFCATLKEGGVQSFPIDGLERARIEAGIPAAGKELHGDMIPVEAGMAHTISYTKGCYAGQEVIAKIKYLGEPPKTLKTLLLEEGGGIPEVGSRILRDGKELGKVTSSTASGVLNRPVALGFLKTRASKGIETVDVQIGESATVKAHVQLEPAHWGSGFPFPPAK